jgi:Uncharacterized protein family UPF0029
MRDGSGGVPHGGQLTEASLAEIEMLSAAYPDEITVVTDPDAFPVQLMVRLSNSAHFVMEYSAGYPTVKDSLSIASYRSNLAEKRRLETSLLAFRDAVAAANQEECGFTAVSQALECWNQYEQASANLVNEQQACLVVKDELKSDHSVEPHPYHWISGDAVVIQKSTFVGHVCRIRGEKDIKPALNQLISGNSRLQRATHNMVRAWVSYD